MFILFGPTYRVFCAIEFDSSALIGSFPREQMKINDLPCSPVIRIMLIQTEPATITPSPPHNAPVRAAAPRLPPFCSHKVTAPRSPPALKRQRSCATSQWPRQLLTNREHHLCFRPFRRSSPLHRLPPSRLTDPGAAYVFLTAITWFSRVTEWGVVSSSLSVFKSETNICFLRWLEPGEVSVLVSLTVYECLIRLTFEFLLLFFLFRHTDRQGNTFWLSDHLKCCLLIWLTPI